MPRLRSLTAVTAAVYLCATALADPISTTNPTNSSTTNPADASLSDSDRRLKQIQSELNKEVAPTTLPLAPPVVPATAPTPFSLNPTTVPAPSLFPPDQGTTTNPSTFPFTDTTTTGPTSVPGGQATTPGELGNVIVESNLDRTRDQIAPALGAVTYTIGQDQIDVVPQGENATFQQVLLRAPGVVEDSYGQEHVRGEHANLTYRVDGVLLPESLNQFGQEIDTRLINSVTLIDGSLPAQFGFRTAGIIDVTTKSGASLDHNEVSLYGGTYNTFNPSVQFGGVDGKLDYFFSGSSKQDSLGIESPTAGTHALHDDTEQQRIFGYASYRLDDTSRISLIVNGSNGDFQIPATAGIAPAFTLAGHAHPQSADDDENQNEQEYYTVVSYLKTTDDLSLQLSAFTQYSQIHFAPDPVSDLAFQGVSGDVLNLAITNGVQMDVSYKADPNHTIRGGFLGQYTSERLVTSTELFFLDPVTGAQTSTSPSTIADNSGNHGTSSGIYLQDEWKLNKHFTLNCGLRYDRFDTNFADNGQISPRVNLVWQPDKKTTYHVGYSRYFVPPPLQWVQPGSIAKYGGTTNASAITADDAPKVETSNYYDVGVSRQVTAPWKVNFDAFYKQAHNLIDNGQFGAPVILSTFNYNKGEVYGAELSSTYSAGGFEAFGNFSVVETQGEDISSNQFLFDPAEFAYIKNHAIKLDHEGNYTVSAGVSYAWKYDRVYMDLTYGSGLRKGFANLEKTQQYIPVNIGWEHRWVVPGSKNVVKLRGDILNVFDEGYQLRDGTGIGVAAAQYGQRRTFLAGLSYEF
jgi:outer membrane receptor protein involved in Fe transport